MRRFVLIALATVFLVAPADAGAWQIKNFSAFDAGSTLRYRVTFCAESSAKASFKVMLFDDDGMWVDAIATRRWSANNPDPDYCYRHTFRQVDDFSSGAYAAQLFVRYRGHTKWAPVFQFRIS